MIAEVSKTDKIVRSMKMHTVHCTARLFPLYFSQDSGIRAACNLHGFEMHLHGIILVFRIRF